MPNRRDFLETVGSAAAGMLVAGRVVDAVAQAGRKEVFINGRRVPVVDIHAHCVWPEVAEVIQGTNLGGRNFPAAWTVGPQRLEVMDTRGIDIQVLNVSPWWYAADRDLARRIVSVHDEQLAAWCREHPDRFVAITSVALQHPDLAADQLEYAVNELGMRGAAIRGHVEGESLSSPKFDPFWAKAEELQATVFMHPGGHPSAASLLH